MLLTGVHLYAYLIIDSRVLSIPLHYTFLAGRSFSFSFSVIAFLEVRYFCHIESDIVFTTTEKLSIH
jgi:hypothetical protein